MGRKLLELLPNRVRRNYRGGAEIEKLQGKDGGRDSERPEEWVASLVAAKNPGLPPLENEGFSRCRLEGEPLLVDVIKADPVFYLGASYEQAGGIDLGFLLKILDSSMRLHVQAHPTAEFAQKHLGSRYGKLECYYILSVREGTKPYIRLGFQHLPTRAEWKRIIAEQDMAAMDACFEPVPIAPGEIWYIPGGVPHAIGENVLMLEIMEPSDLVVRCEFEREGILVPPEARFMGKGLDFCLDIFQYTEQSVAEITQKYRLTPKKLAESAAGYEELAGPPAVKGFSVRRLVLDPGAEISIGGEKPTAVIVTRGKAVIETDGERAAVDKGSSLFIAAAAKSLCIQSASHEETEVCFVAR